MDFPKANNYHVHSRNLSIESFDGVKYIKIYQCDWDMLKDLPESDYDNSGLSYKSFNKGFIKLTHRNKQTDEYWEQLKLWLEEQLN